MDSESFVKDKLKEYKEKRAAVAVMIKDLQDKVKEFKEVNAQYLVHKYLTSKCIVKMRHSL